MRRISEYTIDDLLKMAIGQRASDLHITAELPPQVRVDGRLRSLDFEPLTTLECQRLIFGILNDRQIANFESRREIDLSYGITGMGRFRVNVYRQRGSVGAALRVIPTVIPSFEELNLPMILRELADRNSGLILVTGPTGCGKSTVVASIDRKSVV